MKRAAIAALALGLSTLAADLPGKWSSWRYARAVETPAGEAGPVALTLPWALYARCASGCMDARLVDARGEETPYAALEQLPAARSEIRSARILETSFVAGRYTQVVGDLGQAFEAYDRVIVDTDRSGLQASVTALSPRRFRLFADDGCFHISLILPQVLPLRSGPLSGFVR